jgi:hypothetical protein
MPGITSNVTSLTATTLPNHRDTPLTRITGELARAVVVGGANALVG